MMTEQELNARKKALGYTTEQVAELSGIPLGTVQKIFSGQTRSPRYDTMQKLEQVLCPERAPGLLRESGVLYKAEPEEDPPARRTLEDFYALPEGTRAELLNGVLYVLEAPTTIHQVIALQIGHMLEAHIDAHDGSCVPFLAPVDVRFSDDAEEILEPDVVMVCDREKIHKKGITGAPDFVVEILSPSNTMQRMFIKKNRYLKNRVREYWEIDPEDRSITVMILASEPEAEPEYITRIYDFEDQVPVAVWNGACMIDFKKILRRLEAISQN